jgi:hypothetical protein
MRQGISWPPIGSAIIILQAIDPALTRAILLTAITMDNSYCAA